VIDALVSANPASMNTQNGGSGCDVIQCLFQGSLDVLDLRFCPRSYRLGRRENKIKTWRPHFVQQANVMNITLKHRKQDSDQSMTATQIRYSFTADPVSHTRKKLKAFQNFLEWHGPVLAQFTSKD
jgi:hypothetical protein